MNSDLVWHRKRIKGKEEDRMTNSPSVKIGIVVGSTDWLPMEVAIKKREELVARYKEEFGEDGIYECPICITDNEVSVKRALKDLSKAECDGVCLYWGNYGPESAGTLLAEEYGGPVMMIAAAEEGGQYQEGRLDAMSGFINACYALGLRNTKVYIPNKPVGTVKECVQMVRGFLPKVSLFLALRNLKLIQFGPRPSSYLASCAPVMPLYHLGIELSEYSELELFNSYAKHDGDKRIDKILSEMEAQLGIEEGAGRKSLLPMAQYEVTVEDWIRNHKGNRKYVTMTSTCWPAFPVNFGFVPCYVNSRLTEKGVPVACEVDAYGAVSEYIGQCISGDQVTILNINNNVPSDIYEAQVKGKEFNGKTYQNSDLFLGYHCGVTCASKLCDRRLKLHYVNHRLIGEEQSNGTIQGRIQEGPVTLFRLQNGDNEGLKAYVVQGQILPVEMDTYGGYGVIAVPQMERFFRNVILEKHFPNHVAVLFGHVGEALTDTLKWLGVKEIDYNHPASVPYKNEMIDKDWY